MATRQDLIDLLRLARQSLATNIHRLGDGHYLAAGQYQFRSLWTRDFLWSVRGLVACDDDVARNVITDQLDRLFRDLDKHPDGYKNLLPRVLDSMKTTWRVTISVALRRPLPLTSDLKEELFDQYRGIAFDGNMLAVLMAARYLKSRAAAWYERNKRTLASLLRFYDGHRGPDGVLLDQPPYSDWQDSIDRRGATFLSNLIYACALGAVTDDPAFAVDPDALATLREQIDREFFDERAQLYRSWASRDQISLDGNLLAIDLDYLSLERKVALYRNLLRHPLWASPGGPGFVTWRDYDHTDKSPLVRNPAVGLRGYHDSLYWSWLIALSAKVSAEMVPHVPEAAEHAERLFERLVRMARRDNGIGEVYRTGDEPFVLAAPRYRSDHPFSWGAAFVIDATTYALEHVVRA
ncbi:MAG TPA: hypothetical protein VLB44_01035 [Kofleriaceae bacterium]|nr:hypothetical protein [Kofleriaceae bacterium]